MTMRRFGSFRAGMPLLDEVTPFRHRRYVSPPEFKELALKRVGAGSRTGAAVPEVGLVDMTMRSKVKLAKAGRPSAAGGKE